MVLITGGAGLVGRHLAAALIKKGKQVRSLGWPEVVGDATLSRIGVDVRHGDITDSTDLIKAMPGCGTIFHLAALLSSPENSGKFHTVNVEGTRRVLEAAVAHGVAHFIYISSISVTYLRRNPYSASKAEAETWVGRYPSNWTLVRPCLVVDGFGGGAEYRAFGETVRRWPLLFLPRRGVVWKRPIHVEDLGEALARIEGNARCFGKTYALGGSDRVSLAEMAGVFRRRGGFPQPILPLPAGLLRLAASASESMSRIAGRKLSWLCPQSVDGLEFDADPEMEETCADLGFTPRGFRSLEKRPTFSEAVETSDAPS